RSSCKTHYELQICLPKLCKNMNFTLCANPCATHWRLALTAFVLAGGGLSDTVYGSTVRTENIILQQTATGRVTDLQGNPLEGVSVKVKGSQLSTVTDAQGRFSLANVPQGATLEVSSIGFTSIEIAARSEEHTSELQSRENLVCRLLLEKKKNDRH